MSRQNVNRSGGVRVMLLAAMATLATSTAVARAEQPLQISGVYPHLCTYAHADPEGRYKTGSECGIGAVVPWAGKLWMINYAAHMPKGSDHKLYSIDADLKMTVHPESVGGTPAGRMIHRESKQLLIGPYLISEAGVVRVISPKLMPGRITAIARHLTDPARKVYYYMMEGELWEADVQTLEAKMLFRNPLPGWHGKGGYTSQGRLVVSNNGEDTGHEPREHWQVTDSDAFGPIAERAGSLAEFDGQRWRLIERRQFTDVTGPGDIHGAPDDTAPLWAIGWDRRSLRLKLLENGEWHTYLLPKAAYNNDPPHGWFTEWPRIRALAGGKAMMDMHGMFFDFPLSFSRGNSAGIRPISSHLRYIPDFCEWNGRIVLATDETSVQGNPLGGQPQSNLWFGTMDDIRRWGPRSAYGGPWVNDPVKANVPSDPFHVAGYPRRVLHIVHGSQADVGAKSAAPSASAATGSTGRMRTVDKYPLTQLPEFLHGLPSVIVPRGAFEEPGRAFRFHLDQPATVYLLVDGRAVPELAGWKQTNLTAAWSGRYRDVIFKRDFPAGDVEVPANTAKVTDVNFGAPHAAFIAGEGVRITAGDGARVVPASAAPNVKPAAPPAAVVAAADDALPVRITLEADRTGNGAWQPIGVITSAPGQLVSYYLPDDLNVEWIRLIADRDVPRLSAFFHFTESGYRQPGAAASLFAGLAEITDTSAVHAAVIRPSPTRYDLNVITRTVHAASPSAESFVDLTPGMQFKPGAANEDLRRLLTTSKLSMRVDAASVIVTHNGVDYRLPKGDDAFDAFGESTFVRLIREVESERELANIHGTFYEVPLIKVGSPPLIHKLRPVASHNRQIYDFMTWRGLLTLSGVRADAPAGPHILKAANNSAALWVGAIDDLWHLGKPVGRGGPWKQTAVAPGVPSDPYLMTGYDRKTLELQADRAVNITIEVDIDHQSGWHVYQTITLKPGETLRHVFPAAFSAHWARLRADAPANVTATFIYE